MAGRGRGRANTLPAWMTKAGLNAPPAPGSAPPSAGEGPPPPPPARKGQFDDAPEPAPRGPPPKMNNGMGEPSGGKRRSRSRDRGNRRNCGDFRGPPPPQERQRSRSRDRGNGRDYRSYENDRRREDPYPREPPHGRSRSRSRSRDRRDYRGDYRRGGDRYEDRGYSARGPRDDYRRNDGRPMVRDDEALERGYRRPMPSNGHDDRTSRRYASDYQP